MTSNISEKLKGEIPNKILLIEQRISKNGQVKLQFSPSYFSSIITLMIIDVNTQFQQKGKVINSFGAQNQQQYFPTIQPAQPPQTFVPLAVQIEPRQADKQQQQQQQQQLQAVQFPSEIQSTPANAGDSLFEEGGSHFSNGTNNNNNNVNRSEQQQQYPPWKSLEEQQQQQQQQQHAENSVIDSHEVSYCGEDVLMRNARIYHTSAMEQEFNSFQKQTTSRELGTNDAIGAGNGGGGGLRSNRNDYSNGFLHAPPEKLSQRTSSQASQMMFMQATAVGNEFGNGVGQEFVYADMPLKQQVGATYEQRGRSGHNNLNNNENNVNAIACEINNNNNNQFGTPAQIAIVPVVAGVAGNSREKNQKTGGKKRKTVQTLVIPGSKKFKKSDNPIPSSIFANSAANAATSNQPNRPRIGSDSSEDDESFLQQSAAGSMKITHFFSYNKKPAAITSTLATTHKGNPQTGSFNQDAAQPVSGTGIKASSIVKDNTQLHQEQQQQLQQLKTFHLPPAPASSITNSMQMPDPQPEPQQQLQQSQVQQIVEKQVNKKQTPSTAQIQASTTGEEIRQQQSARDSQVGTPIGHGLSPPPTTSTSSNSIQTTLRISQNSTKMIVDPKIEMMHLVLEAKERDLAEKNSTIKYLEHDYREIERAYKNLDQNFSTYKEKVQKIVMQQLLDIEKMKREETRFFIAKEKQRLGEYVQTRDCTKFDETWQEGTEFKKIEERLNVIRIEKEELEKKKKTIKGSRKSTSESDIQQDLVISEAKQRINLQLQFLQKEETDLQELKRGLEHERFLFIQKLKRFQDEQNSRYGQTWPFLGERYQLLSLLGRGGFSEVYKAYDIQDFKEVACKIHQLNLNWSEPSKANYIKHAVRESKIHSELKHPNIVQLFDTVEIDNNSFATILEYCEGPDLYFYLKKNKILQEKEAKMLVKQILSALKYMNSQKTRIIHYDLKPQNIIFHKGELKISDFGLSKIFEDGQTRMELTSQGVGTYWYLPPETFEFENSAQISPKVDIWSVGVIFFEMVFGQRPFGNNKSQDQILKENIILKSTQVNFPSKPNVSNECKDFIRNCLTYDQNRRWDIIKAWDSPYMNTKYK